MSQLPASAMNPRLVFMATTGSEQVSKMSWPRRRPGSRADPRLISSTAIFMASAQSRPSEESLRPHRVGGDDTSSLLGSTPPALPPSPAPYLVHTVVLGWVLGPRPVSSAAPRGKSPPST